jgi:NAD(P)-dependent dehydrogenase (short-subunit alcohol dehydrogenase family)
VRSDNLRWRVCLISPACLPSHSCPSSREAISTRCDVTSWEDQVALFDAALQRFGTINVVVANAGVTEHMGLGELKFANGKALKPNLTTTNVNYVAVMYSE